MSFDEIASRFWASEVLHGVQPPLTDEALYEAERTIGRALPRELVHLLRIQNGGYLRRDLRAHQSPEPTSWAATWVPFDQCFGIGTDGMALTDTPYLLEEWGLPGGLVLLSGDGHAWIALDYRSASGGDPPSVIYVDADSGLEVLLAPSFRVFVEGLIPEPAEGEA
jgi:hypothetical protein